MKARIAYLDIIRGYAIFGILLCNVVLFHTPAEYMFTYFGAHNSWSDQLSEFIRFAYFGDRTYTLFSMLFGIGIGMQYVKYKNLNSSFTGYHFVRMALLLFIGVFHAVFIWYGDILAMYALLGLIAVLFIKLNPKPLLYSSLLFYLIPTILTILVRNDLFHLSLSDNEVEPLEELIRMNTESGILGHIQYNASQHIPTIQFYLTGNIYTSFSMILFGLAMVKLELHEKISAHLHHYKRLLGVTLPIIVFWTIYYLFFFDPASIKSSLQFYSYWALFNISGLSQTFLVIAVIILLNRNSSWWTKIANGLGFLGRMSLTNYLLHSVSGLIIFKIFGLYGESSPTLDTIGAIVFTIFEIYLSKWWLSRYGMGPLESIWRISSKWVLKTT